MDDKFYTDQDPVIRLRVWALGQMIWGGFLAAAVVVGIGAVLVVIWIISMLLPEQSKQAPSPYVALEIVQTVQVA
ncbi:MAG: RC-LH1 core complex protein PufX [Candidatus Saccharibacteria bacterium]|nr:RC-LH1 core complex protein PufX [Pseudorhodobacter sp.]